MHIRLRVFLLSLFLLLLAGGSLRAQITAGFTFTPLNGCSPQVVQFTNTSTGTITSYTWNFGNGAPTSSFTNPSTSYTSPGTYTVTLTVVGPSGTKTATATVVIYPPPTVSFTFSPSSGCAPLPVSFTATVIPGVTGSVTYYWDFGDGYTSPATSPTHIYNTAGNFTSSVTVTNSKGCATTYTSTNLVTVYPKPVGSFSAFPTNNCSLPAVVGFSNTVSGSPPISVSWSFGNGTGTGNNPTNIYSVAGTYNVIMYMNDANGCQDSVVQAAYISAQPNLATFSGPTTGCDSSSNTFTNTTTGSSATIWNFGDGSGNFIGGTQAHVYTAPGTYPVRMVTQVNACSDTIIKNIVIGPKPVSWLTYDTPCPPPSTLHYLAHSSIPGTTYQWAWAGGGTATGPNPTRSYTYGQVDSVRLIATSPGGCIDTVKYDSVFVYNMIPNRGVLPYEGCAPLTSVYSDVLQTNIPCMPWGIFPCPVLYPIPIISWDWVFDGNPANTASGNPVTHTFNGVGNHYAAVAMTTANGCVFRDTITVATGRRVPPSFIGGPDTTCVKVPIHFTNTTGDTSIAYHWYWGDGFTTDDYHGDYKYKRPGTYTIMLISDFNGCFDTVIHPLLVTILPSDATFRDSIYCPPSRTVKFTDISIGATTHLWDFGDGTPTTNVQHPVHTFAQPGIYAVKQITWNSTYGCRDTVIDTVHIVPLNLSFSASDTTLCQRDTIHLRASYSGPPLDSMRWYINNVWANPLDSAVKYIKDSMLAATGFYKVALYIKTNVGGNTCRDSLVKNNYVIMSHPSAGFSASPVVGCIPMLATFTDTTFYTPGTQRGNVFWIFGNGDTLRTTNASEAEVYRIAGKYTVKMVVTDWNGCPDSILKQQYINARKPSAYYQIPSQNACIGTNIAFTNLSTGATSLVCSWNFGDGDTSSAFYPNHTYKTVGTFIARLVVFDSSGCSDTMSLPIYITKPVAAFSLSDTMAICPPLIVKFTSTSTNAATYAWDFNNTGTASIPNPVSTFSTPGIYTIVLIVKDANGCADTARAKVRVLGYAGALSYGPLKGCHPMTVNFTANIANIPSIVWDFADGLTAPGVGLTASHTYLTPGAYVPKLIFSDGAGCSASSIGIDTIKVDGVIAGFKVLPPCEKTPVQFIDTSHSYFSAMNDWRWDFGPLGMATGNPVTKTFGAAGVYTVKLIAGNSQGCKDTISRDFTIFPLPKIVAMDDTAVCVPDGIPLSVKGGISYSWYPGTSLSCTACENPIAAPTVPTSYVVTGTDSMGCMNKDTVRIGIQTKSTFVTAASGEICLGQHFQLFAAGATVYNWTPTESLDSPNVPHPIATPKVNTTYIVTGREGSCLADTHSVRVIVRPLPVIDAGADVKAIAGRGVLLQATGFGVSRVEWDKDSSLSSLTSYAPYATPRVTTTYHITAFNDYGCTSTDSVRVTVLCDGSQLFIPNTFSPNGDGNNDLFFPRGVGIDHINSFRVYSRWGELLFERTHVSVNDEQNGWNGTYGGRILNPDVYVYIIEATCDTGEPIKFKGDVTLLR